MADNAAADTELLGYVASTFPKLSHVEIHRYRADREEAVEHVSPPQLLRFYPHAAHLAVSSHRRASQSSYRPQSRCAPFTSTSTSRTTMGRTVASPLSAKRGTPSFNSWVGRLWMSCRTALSWNMSGCSITVCLAQHGPSFIPRVAPNRAWYCSMTKRIGTSPLPTFLYQRVGTHATEPGILSSCHTRTGILTGPSTS